ncbi:MAG: hypothetical protein K0R61_1762 [Microvirga sp.]|jgi:hypothetical protein|nr:hypothetical protein [Microvirga sp.]
MPLPGDVLEVDADELGAAEGAGEPDGEERAIAEAALDRDIDRGLRQDVGREGRGLARSHAERPVDAG